LADEDALEAVLEGLADAEDSEKEGLFKCMMLLAVNARNNARFHSGQQERGQFSAVSALEMKAAQIQVLVQEEMDLLHQVRGCLKNNSSRLIQNLTRF